MSSYTKSKFTQTGNSYDTGTESRSKYIKMLINTKDSEGKVIIPNSDDIDDSVINYINFVNGWEQEITNEQLLIDCFNLVDDVNDNNYFDYLLTQLCNGWNHLMSTVDELNISLQRDIYLHLPYETLPQVYIDDGSFINEWLDNNKNKNITLNKIDVYHNEYRSNTYNYDNYYNILDTFHTTNGTKIGIRKTLVFYFNGKLRSETNDYKSPEDKDEDDEDDEDDDDDMSINFGGEFCGTAAHNCRIEGAKHGVQRKWYNDEQHTLESENNYEYGKKLGYQRTWYSGPQHLLESEEFYVSANHEDNDLDGHRRHWFNNSQHSLSFDYHYKNGRKDGYQREWYDDEQHTLKSEELFDNGSQIGYQRKWYNNNNRHTLEYEAFFEKDMHGDTLVSQQFWQNDPQHTLRRSVFLKQTRNGTQKYATREELYSSSQ